MAIFCAECPGSRNQIRRQHGKQETKRPQRPAAPGRTPEPRKQRRRRSRRIRRRNQTGAKPRPSRARHDDLPPPTPSATKRRARCPERRRSRRQRTIHPEQIRARQQEEPRRMHPTVRIRHRRRLRAKPASTATETRPDEPRPRKPAAHSPRLAPVGRRLQRTATAPATRRTRPRRKPRVNPETERENQDRASKSRWHGDRTSAGVKQRKETSPGRGSTPPGENYDTINDRARKPPDPPSSTAPPNNSEGFAACVNRSTRVICSIPVFPNPRSFPSSRSLWKGFRWNRCGRTAPKDQRAPRSCRSARPRSLSGLGRRAGLGRFRFRRLGVIAEVGFVTIVVAMACMGTYGVSRRGLAGSVDDGGEVSAD